MLFFSIQLSDEIFVFCVPVRKLFELSDSVGNKVFVYNSRCYVDFELTSQVDWLLDLLRDIN